MCSTHACTAPHTHEHASRSLHARVHARFFDDMCGRYYVDTSAIALEELGLAWAEEQPFAPQYNVAPTHLAPVVLDVAPHQVQLLRWGLIPHWAKDPSIGPRLINARAESLPGKPAFRDAFRARRCLVLTSGFYEWEKRRSGKQPYVIRRRDGHGAPLAGLWESWRAPTGERVRTFTVITCPASPLLAPIHDRQPVVLDAEGCALWLSHRTSEKALLALLRPLPDATFERYPVDRAVGSPAHDTADCIAPITLPAR